MAKKPPRAWIEYTADWRHAPMAYWVHVPRRDAAGDTTYDPPAPMQHGRAGFAVLCVEFGTGVLRFSSPAQLDEAIRVLAMKPLPTTRRLSLARKALESAPAPPHNRAGRERATGMAGPNSHWLSRLPASLKATKARERVVEGLRAIRGDAVRGDAFALPPER